MKIQVSNIPCQTAYDTETARLIAEHYDTLKCIARAKRRRSRPGQTLLTTDLLHESWLKLRKSGGWNNEAHFIRSAAQAMRHVLIDYARSKLTKKQGQNAKHYAYDEIAECLPEYKETPEQIVIIGDLLTKLVKLNPRLVDIVDMRYFSGFTEKETADVLGVSARTIRRDWTMAKAWLATEMA